MLYGKTLVITGVASGIGKRCAELAEMQGADVIGIDICEPKMVIGRFIRADISTAQGVEALLKELPSGIDALCNVAGLSGRDGAALTLAVNFYGLRMLTEGLAGRIREGGSIVNTASIAGYGWRENISRAAAMVGHDGFPDVAGVVADHAVQDAECYPVSKELLLLWTMQAAHQDRYKNRGIRVNAVSPGPVETPILSQFREVLGDERVDRDVDCVGRAGTAQDIAPVILFLCTDAARWINGVNLPVDGGLEAFVNADALNFRA